MRGLIVLVLVIGVAWLACSQRLESSAAVAGIIDAFGSVNYDWEWSNGKVTQGGGPCARGGSWIALELTVSVSHPCLVPLERDGCEARKEHSIAC